MKKIYFFVLIIFIFSANITVAGPFGTSMGDNESKFNNLKLMNTFPNGSREYSTSNVPTPYSGLDRYILTFNNNGLSKVEGFREFSYRDGADNLFNYFDKIFNQLKNKYGKANVSKKGYGEWTKKLPDNLAKIRVFILPDERKNRAIVFLEYTYKNYVDVKQYYKKDSDAL